MGAFVSDKKVRINLPAAELPCLEGEDAWVDVRPGMSAGLAAKVRAAGDDEGVQAIAYFQGSIVAWSFQKPLSPEAVEDLNVELITYLGNEVASLPGFLPGTDPSSNKPATGAGSTRSSGSRSTVQRTG